MASHTPLTALLALAFLLQVGACGTDAGVEVERLVTPERQPASTPVEPGELPPPEPVPPEAERQVLTAVEPTVPAEPEVPAPLGPRGPELVDLGAIAPFGAPRGCTWDRYDELCALARVLVDPHAGAQGGRAGRSLEEEGKFAIPAILNELLQLDLSQNDGFRSADVCQKTLQRICNGNNFGWYYQENPEWHYLDKRVIERWCKVWVKADADEAFWHKLGKIEGSSAESGE